MITVRKLKLTIVNENEEERKRQYKFIRDSQYAQYQALNLGMGYIMTGYLANNRDVKSEGFKEPSWKSETKNFINVSIFLISAITPCDKG